jgi:hypothetical protein
MIHDERPETFRSDRGRSIPFGIHASFRCAPLPGCSVPVYHIAERRGASVVSAAHYARETLEGRTFRPLSPERKRSSVARALLKHVGRG